MNSIKYFVPNFLTSLNLICGAIAIVTAFKGHVTIPVYLLLGSALFDFLDGFAAKLLRATSEFGKQLDSLADLISFGLAPSVLIFLMLEDTLPLQIPDRMNNIILYSSFLFVVFAAFRLARFNIQSSASSDFIGLPVPAATLIVVSLWIISLQAHKSFFSDVLLNPILLVIINMAISGLMISRIKMLSLKFKGFGIQPNLWRYLLLTGAIAIFIFFRIESLFWIMIYYLFLSLLSRSTILQSK